MRAETSTLPVSVSCKIDLTFLLLTDLTYPITAYTTGHEFNRGIYKSFYHLHIEDFWLPYFAGRL